MLATLCAVSAMLGVYFVADAGFPGAMKAGNGFRVAQQLLWLLLGVVAYLLAARLPESRWKGLGLLLFGLAWAGCFLVLLPSVGLEVNNARRWIQVPLLKATVQPAEFLKLGSVLFLAWLLEKVPSRPRFRQKPLPWRERAIRALPFLIVIAGAALIEREPDLGTAATVFGILLAMLWLGGVKGKVILGLLAGAVALGAIMILLQPYRLDRILAHNDRWSDEHAAEVGYQPNRSEVGIGMGGLTGLGPGMGVTKHSLPEATTDFIFTTIAEEFGFLGSLAVIALLGTISWRLFWLAERAPSRYAALVAAGCGSWIGGQSALNLLMVTSVIPPVGIPLPFLSMGGSSLIAIAIAMGIVQSLAHARGKEVAADASSGMRWGNRRARLPRHPGRLRRGLSRL